MIKFFRKIFNCHKTKIIKMNQQEQINWLIRQVNRMNNSHCGDGCDYTIPEGCVVWTGEPLMCGETVLANEGDRMDLVQQNIVAFLCSREGNKYSIIANEACPDGGFSFLENGVIVYSQCFSGGGTYTFEANTECPNGGIKVMQGEEVVFEQCYECCGGESEPFYFYSEGRSHLEFENPPTIGDDTTANVYGATQIAFTIPPGKGGIYEVMFNADWFSDPNDDGKIFTYVNNTVLGLGGVNCTHLKRGSASGFDEVELQIPVTHFQSNINLQAGDIIGLCTEGGAMIPEPKPSVQHYRVKVTKIG